MNPSQPPNDAWTRLLSAARRSPDRGDAQAPYGFATRVVALADVTPRRAGSLFERFALRAVGVAALLAIGSAAFTLTQSPAPGPNSDVPGEVANEDALSELVDA